MKSIFEHDISLAPLTTLKVGGSARVFIRIKDKEDLIKALSYAAQENMEILILGGGSNMLVGDSGFDGLVLKMEIDEISYREKFGKVRVLAGAGVDWDHLVEETVKRGLYGLENLSLIPGSVGASPVQNIGAYGAEVNETIEWVDAVNKDNLEERRFSNSECMFGYRNSFFKTPEGKKWVITHVGFLLPPSGELNTSYKEIDAYFKENTSVEPTLETVREAVIHIRSAKFPSLKTHGTAGSFFKNPVLKEGDFKALQEKYPEIPSYPAPNGVKVPLAWILDHILKLNGYKEDSVGLFENQPLVLVTNAGATSEDVTRLAKQVQAKVKKSTGIDIEMEVQVV